MTEYTAVRTDTDAAPEQTEITEEWLDRLRDKVRGKFTNYCRVDVEIAYEHHGERTIEGTLIDLGLNHPNFRFEDKSHGFISAAADPSDTPYLLFNKGWEGKGGAMMGYKYPITEVSLEIDYFEHPVCPVCDETLEYGYDNWSPSEGEGGYTSQWLCPECYPRKFKRGIQ